MKFGRKQVQQSPTSIHNFSLYARTLNTSPQIQLPWQLINKVIVAVYSNHRSATLCRDWSIILTSLLEELGMSVHGWKRCWDKNKLLRKKTVHLHAVVSISIHLFMIIDETPTCGLCLNIESLERISLIPYNIVVNRSPVLSYGGKNSCANARWKQIKRIIIILDNK